MSLGLIVVLRREFAALMVKFLPFVFPPLPNKSQQTVHIHGGLITSARFYIPTFLTTTTSYHHASRKPKQRTASSSVSAGGKLLLTQ